MKKSVLVLFMLIMFSVLNACVQVRQQDLE